MANTKEHLKTILQIVPSFTLDSDTSIHDVRIEGEVIRVLFNTHTSLTVPHLERAASVICSYLDFNEMEFVQYPWIEVTYTIPR